MSERQRYGDHHRRLPPLHRIETAMPDCDRQACSPPGHRESYHAPRDIGRMSQGGTHYVWPSHVYNGHNNVQQQLAPVQQYSPVVRSADEWEAIDGLRRMSDSSRSSASLSTLEPQTSTSGALQTPSSASVFNPSPASSHATRSSTSDQPNNNSHYPSGNALHPSQRYPHHYSSQQSFYPPHPQCIVSYQTTDFYPPQQPHLAHSTLGSPSQQHRVPVPSFQHSQSYRPYSFAPMATPKRERSDDGPVDGMTPPPPKKVKSQEVVQDYACFFARCKNSLADGKAQVPGRKVISQFFGRNKNETKLMPPDIMPTPCRKCYQQHSYRRKNQADVYMSQLQAKLIKVALVNCEKYEGHRDWKIGFNKQLNDAVDESRPHKNPCKGKHVQRCSTDSDEDEGSVSNSGQSVSPSNMKPRRVAKLDRDVVRFAISLEQEGLTGSHKTTEQVRRCVELMDRFSAEHPKHHSSLPGVEFLAQGDWPGLKAGETPIKTQKDLPRLEQEAEEQAEHNRNLAMATVSPGAQNAESGARRSLTTSTT